MTDERDPKLSQRYGELPAAEPSRELDQTILAAAHRAADKPHAPLLAPAGRHRWYFSLAAAAILVLAVAVTVHVERQQPDAELAVPASPVPAPQHEKPAPAQQAEPAAAAPELKRETRARQERSRTDTPEPPPAAPAGQQQPGARAMADSVAARADENRVAEERARAASRAASSPRASSAPVTQYAAPSPELELERIAELRAQGRDDEADKALAEFQKRYPGYQIPQAMREKVERKAAR